MLRWRWDGGAPRASQYLRCKPEQWLLLRTEGGTGPALRVEFADERTLIASREVALARLDESNGECVGWVQAPPACRRLRVLLNGGGAPDALAMIAVAERDPKCHPLANTPRWSTYRTPFPFERVVVPRSLESLAPLLSPLIVEAIDPPRSLRELARRAVGAACIVGPEWVASASLSLCDVEKLAPACWMVVDLPTMASMARRARVADGVIACYTSSDEIMSARVEYADVHTRGFALMDVLPYGTREHGRRFGVRVLKASRAWKRYADDTGFALMLSSQTPWESRCNDVLMASRAMGNGELIATDLPWLAAGALGAPLAPRLAAHLLRALFGLPIDDAVQYWVRWDDPAIVVRDVADMVRRFAPLQTARWAAQGGSASLGVLLPAVERERRRLVLRAGSIDAGAIADGVPAEPLMILMKWLAREARERTAFARRALADTSVVWQFETRDGARYAGLFHAAGGLPPREERVVSLRDAAARWPLGALGEGSVEFQAALTDQLRQWLG